MALANTLGLYNAIPWVHTLEVSPPYNEVYVIL